jgi:23S rRNA (uracil1939-C5)-methyltransferase
MQGDGVGRLGAETVYVPYTLPGDRVAAHRAGAHHALPVEWLARGPGHETPACPHFGRCGGCALQHLDDAVYARWKVDKLRNILSRHGFEDIPTATLARTPPGARRRAEFAAHRIGGLIALGFHARLSHDIVAIDPCPVLDPALVSLLPHLRTVLARLIDGGTGLDVLATHTDSGIDLVFTGLPPGRGRREMLAAYAQERDLARIAWRSEHENLAEIIVLRRPPRAFFGGVAVELPPGAFIQASLAGETAIAAAVIAGTEGARRIADLYAGCGTLTFPLASASRVHAVENSGEMTAAIDAAARRARLAPRISVERRDLNRRPLTPDELEAYDAIVFDPPREGAQAVTEQLARSGVPRLVGVSCNPATFARDAAILARGGYRLTTIQPIDQFLWSPHLELVGEFKR